MLIGQLRNFTSTRRTLQETFFYQERFVYFFYRTGVFAQSHICLLGNESQTVGPPQAPMQVHKLLLGKGIALLEGVVLKNIPEGTYFLSAAPLNLSAADGAPCRAYLIEL